MLIVFDTLSWYGSGEEEILGKEIDKSIISQCELRIYSKENLRIALLSEASIYSTYLTLNTGITLIESFPFVATLYIRKNPKILSPLNTLWFIQIGHELFQCLMNWDYEMKRYRGEIGLIQLSFEQLFEFCPEIHYTISL